MYIYVGNFNQLRCTYSYEVLVQNLRLIKVKGWTLLGVLHGQGHRGLLVLPCRAGKQNAGDMNHDFAGVHFSIFACFAFGPIFHLSTPSPLLTPSKFVLIKLTKIGLEARTITSTHRPTLQPEPPAKWNVKNWIQICWKSIICPNLIFADAFICISDFSFFAHWSTQCDQMAKFHHFGNKN